MEAGIPKRATHKMRSWTEQKLLIYINLRCGNSAAAVLWGVNYGVSLGNLHRPLTSTPAHTPTRPHAHTPTQANTGVSLENLHHPLISTPAHTSTRPPTQTALFLSVNVQKATVVEIVGNRLTAGNRFAICSALHLLTSNRVPSLLQTVAMLSLRHLDSRSPASLL